MFRAMKVRHPRECSVCNSAIPAGTLYAFDGSTTMRYCKECYDAADPEDWDKLVERSRTANTGM